MIETRYRRIVTPIPAPDSEELLKKSADLEPRSMGGQPQIVWERAEGFQIHDPYGNKWLDFSSGVLVANAGHGRKEVKEAIEALLNQGLHHNYCFPSRARIEYVSNLAKVLPDPLKKVFLLTTGSETIECAIKIARTHGLHTGGQKKITIVSFQSAFHGRTLGSQMAGGIPALKDWITNLDPNMVQIPFPDEMRSPKPEFGEFEKALDDWLVKPDQVAGVLAETYQGGTAAFASAAYMQQLRDWCNRHGVVLILDEVQAGFGRTGRLFGFEHYGIVPDLACFGKGITSGLPLSAVVGKTDLMDLYGPGEMTSTHSGNPLCCAAARASLDLILNENLPLHAAQLGEELHQRLRGLRQKHSDRIDPIRGRGLVAGIHFRNQKTGETLGQLARNATDHCIRNGVLLFSPVGPGGATIKVNPPLVIEPEALHEGLDVLEEGIESALQ